MTDSIGLLFYTGFGIPLVYFNNYLKLAVKAFDLLVTKSFRTLKNISLFRVKNNLI